MKTTLVSLTTFLYITLTSAKPLDPTPFDPSTLEKIPTRARNMANLATSTSAMPLAPETAFQVSTVGRVSMMPTKMAVEGTSDDLFVHVKRGRGAHRTRELDDCDESATLVGSLCQ